MKARWKSLQYSPSPFANKKLQQSLWIVSSLCFVLPAATACSGRSTTTTTTSSVPSHSCCRGSAFVSTTTTTTINQTFKKLSTIHTTNMVNPKQLDSPSAQRNKAPIWDVLFDTVVPRIIPPQQQQQQLGMTTNPQSPSSPPVLAVLEIAAGAGVHTDYFVTRWLEAARAATTTTAADASMKHHGDEEGGPGLLLEWYPTDPNAESRDSIQWYIQAGNLNQLGVQTPLALTLNQNGIMEPETAILLSAKQPWNIIICINMIHISPWEATLGLFKLANEQLHPDHGVLFCYGPYKENGNAVESNLDFDRSLKSRNPDWGVRDLETVVQAALGQNLVLVDRLDMPANNLSLIFQKRRGI